MPEIKILNGVTIVDDDLVNFVTSFAWRLNEDGYVYVPSIELDGVHYKNLLLHRFILGLHLEDKPWIQVDHKNLIKHDNQKHNLRRSTSGQNKYNTLKREGNFQSKYKGVCRLKNHWRALIQYKRRQLSLGSYREEIYAGYAYDYAALLLAKEFANTNRIKLEPEIELIIRRVVEVRLTSEGIKL